MQAIITLLIVVYTTNSGALVEPKGSLFVVLYLAGTDDTSLLVIGGLAQLLTYTFLSNPV